MIHTRVKRETIFMAGNLDVRATISADMDPVVDWVSLTITRNRGSLLDGPVYHTIRLGDLEEFVAALREEAKLNRGGS